MAHRALVLFLFLRVQLYYNISICIAYFIEYFWVEYFIHLHFIPVALVLIVNNNDRSKKVYMF